MIISSGTELPARTTGLTLLLFYKDSDAKKIRQAITAVVAAYDRSFLTNAVGTMLNGVIDGIVKEQPRGYEGTEARYRLEMAKMPGDPKTLTPIVYVTPR
jgi:hypothetical protein